MQAELIPSPDFFTVSMHEYHTSAVCDFSDCPRPHFCMGLILDGEADFIPEGDASTVHVFKGDIIFVPISSRYRSFWHGDPDIRYISFHFSFSPGMGISERNNFLLQRITVADFESERQAFESALRCHTGTTADRFAALAVFYRLLASILPTLTHTPEKQYDERIRKAVEYIHLHSEEELSIPALATLCNISTSHFYTKFREEIGMTPIDYKNSILISRATRLLLYGDYDSIEAISDALGFASATYFRRVFKKVTGKSPSAYKKSAAEL